jgi:hypothetical protein
VVSAVPDLRVDQDVRVERAHVSATVQQIE